MVLRTLFAALSLASARHLPPLATWEQYLAPYVLECVEYVDDPIVTNYVRMWNLWDFTPRAAVTVIGQLFPTASYTIPVDRDVDVVVTTKPYRKLRIHVKDVTFSDLNKVKKVKSLKLVKDTRYTWRTGIVFEQVTVVIRGNSTFSGRAGDVVAHMVFKDLSVDLDAVAATNASRVCEVYGMPLLLNTDCVFWTVIYDEPVVDNSTRVVSGLNVTNLTLAAKDVEGEIRVNSTENGTAADALWSDTLTAVVFSDKEEVLKELSQNALLLRLGLNRDLFQKVREAHEHEHCLGNDRELDEATEISAVCLGSTEDSEPESNNFTLLDCLALPAGNASETELAPTPVREAGSNSGCARVDHLYPGAQRGHPLRVTVTAQDGSRGVLPRLFRYAPDAPAAALNCHRDGCEVDVARQLQRSVWPWLAASGLAVSAAMVGGLAVWRRRRATAPGPLEDLGTSLQIHSA